MRVHLRSGVDVEDAIRLLRELETNSRSALPPEPPIPDNVRESYVRWAITTERRLRAVLQRSDADALFDNSRHRDICSMPPGSQLINLISGELESKSLDFGDLADYLQTALNRMRRAPGVPIVLDSNVLFQCLRLDQLDWVAEVQDDVRVLLPLRVIEEVDAKKYGGNRRLSEVARELLPWLDGCFPNGDTGPVYLRERATIELLLADRPRHRPSDADEEVLDVCHEVRHLAGRVKLMTADTGMRARARTEGLDVLVPPEKWLRRRTDARLTIPEEAPGGISLEQ